MLDDVLEERLRRAELAASQILNLLGNVFGVETVAAGRQATQQVRLLLGPGVEVCLVERVPRRHAMSITPDPALRDNASQSVYHGSVFVPLVALMRRRQ